MMKRLCSGLGALCLLMALAMPVFAAGSPYLLDNAALLTADEEQMLTEMMADTAETYGCGMYFVSVEDYSVYGRTPYDAAVQLYIDQTLYGDVPEDGILLMLSMRERDYSLITYGAYAEAVFTDEALWALEDGFLQYFRVNDWENGVECFLIYGADMLADYHADMSDRYGDGYVSYYDPGVPEVVVRANRVRPEVWLGVAVGCPVVALIICLVMKAGMRTARRATHADGYIPVGGVKLRIKQDLFTHTTTRVVHHPKPNGGHGGHGGGGGGGGFRGHSGKF